jgi:hypothetical protein
VLSCATHAFKIMFNNHKDIQGAKRRGDCDTKVTCHDPCGLIAKKRCPELDEAGSCVDEDEETLAR